MTSMTSVHSAVYKHKTAKYFWSNKLVWWQCKGKQLNSAVFVSRTCMCNINQQEYHSPCDAWAQTSHLNSLLGAYLIPDTALDIGFAEQIKQTLSLSSWNLSPINWIQCIKGSINHEQVGFIPGVQGWFNTCKTINIMQHVSRIKYTQHTFIPSDQKENLSNMPLR